MRTTPINDNLIQLTRSGFVNAYLVREDDGFTLIDTTLKGGAGELIAAARLAGGDIKRIVLTHGHGDHVGSLETVASPGHTPGHVSFLDTRDRTLIAGDAFSTLGGLATPDKPKWRFPLVWYATCDRPQAGESAR